MWTELSFLKSGLLPSIRHWTIEAILQTKICLPTNDQEFHKIDVSFFNHGFIHKGIYIYGCGGKTLGRQRNNLFKIFQWIF